MRGGGREGERGSDTALCVAMVQAQSELHSSFAAQLVNYPQTAVPTCSKPLFLLLRTSVSQGENCHFSSRKSASKMQWKINAPQRYWVGSAASATPLVIKRSLSAQSFVFCWLSLLTEGQQILISLLIKPNMGHCGLIFTIKISNYVISQIQGLHMLSGISQQAETGGRVVGNVKNDATWGSAPRFQIISVIFCLCCCNI